MCHILCCCMNVLPKFIGWHFLNMGEQRVMNGLPYIFTLESVIVVGLGNVLSVILVENKIFMYFLNKVFMKYLVYVYY